MFKKVLSVALALVLALGVCAVAASAATTSQLQKALESLPSEYNAQFYNDSTKALILEARSAAEAALENGDGINAAYALCQDAYDAANDGEELWVDAIDDYMWVYTNRDESKAVADFYFETDAADYLMPGDTFTVTVSLKTNFFIRTMYTGFAYDKTKFEYVPNSISYASAFSAAMDVDTGSLSDKWGYNALGNELDGGLPESWTADQKAQYGLLEKVFIANTTGDYFWPEEKTELYTVTMKVKDDAALDETGRIYADEVLCATKDNYLLGNYNYALIEFSRAYGSQPTETVTDMDGVRVPARSVQDETACSGQTINFHDADITVTIGEEPVDLDWTNLEAAVAVKDTLDELDYTEESWAAYAAAVEAGADELEEKTSDTQEKIDAFTTEINAKYDALELFEQDSEIISITEKTTPVAGKFVTLEVLISKPATKIQFVDPAGSTSTYYAGYDRVISIVENEDGTQTWTIKKMVNKLSETYKVFPRFGKIWDTKYYRYILKDSHEFDKNIYSVTIPDAKDGRIYVGRHDVVVETGLDVLKVQFAYLGTTATFTADNATIEEKDGRNFWTINFAFVKAGEGFKADVLGRTTITSFEKADVALTADVFH